MKLKPLVCLSLIKLVGSFALMTQAQTFSVIHRFTGVEGRYPEAGVTVRGNSLYGTAFEGGNSFGSVYEVQRVGSDWVVEEGLKPGDQVVAEGLQAVRDGLTVRTKPLPPPGTPAPAGPASGEAK